MRNRKQHKIESKLKSGVIVVLCSDIIQIPAGKI